MSDTILTCLICGERSEFAYLMNDVVIGDDGLVNVIAICEECYGQVEERGFACRPLDLAAFSAHTVSMS